MYSRLYPTLIAFAFGFAAVIWACVLLFKIYSFLGITLLLMPILFYGVCFGEADSIQNKVCKIIGYLLPALHFIIIFLGVIRIQLPTFLLVILGAGIVINLIFAALIDKNRDWFHYILIAFVSQFVITLHLDINLLSDFVLLLELAGIMIAAVIYMQYLDREEV